MSNSVQSVAALTPAITPEFHKVNRENPSETHVLIGLKGRFPEEGEQRKPLRIIAAVDHSGSMGGKKIEYLRASMRAMVRQLSDKDYLGIVAFGSNVWTIAPPTRCDQKGRETLLTQIDTLGATSMTNLCSGATEAITMLRNVDVDRKDCIERVFLLTDGCPTSGVTNDDQVVSLISKAAGEDVNVTTFGYGDDDDGMGGYNPNLLQAIASTCRGNFHHIPGPDAVPKALASEMGGLMTTVAQNIKVIFSLKDNVQILDVLNDIDVNTDGGNRTTISVDDLYIDEEKAVVVLLKLPAFNKAAGARPKKNLGTITVQWLDTRTGQVESQELELTFDFVKPGEEDKTANPQVEKQVALLNAAEAQRQAIEKANAGDYQGAQTTLNNAAVTLQACNLFNDDMELQQVCQIYHANISNYSAQKYNPSVAQMGAGIFRSISTKRDASAGTFALYSNAGTECLVDAMSADVDKQFEEEQIKPGVGTIFPALPRPSKRPDFTKPLAGPDLQPTAEEPNTNFTKRRTCR